MGFFSFLFGGDDDNCNRLNIVPDTHEEHVDTIIQFTKFPDVRQALLEDSSLTQEQRKAMYKINNAYKGIEQQTWKEWEADYERECQEDMKRRNEEYKKRQEQEQESESRGWFFGLF